MPTLQNHRADGGREGGQHLRRQAARNSRASNATMSTVDPARSAGRTRSPVGESPNTAIPTRASIGVMNGWSTYPHAGC